MPMPRCSLRAPGKDGRDTTRDARSRGCGPGNRRGAATDVQAGDASIDSLAEATRPAGAESRELGPRRAAASGVGRRRRERMSNKPSVVLVHGFWGGATHWAKVIVELK